ncbi:double zinc ribbon and ankyrin repeat-containing protein 1 [Lampris incognitus]|uniref:double zinc ribbon and ankyrin repeat-containing protein 1 n=1 Tax=Lampris incognitus TaxID=2546036 RepID=UPI0024B5B09E|nr:double zinc ribbon and ankyrin repeat-containing protein 1 [Lampris incognitus]
MSAACVGAPLIVPLVFRPPRAKNEILTSTPVEIKSNTPGVQIYYTLDGTKPDVVQRSGSGVGSTQKYCSPVLLPAGRVSVRSVAVTSDGRESAVVTKRFLVNLNESVSRKENTEDRKENVSRKENMENRKENKQTEYFRQARCGDYITPPLLSGQNDMVSCSKCHRMNQWNARYCDWCGSKPLHTVSLLLCSRCGASSAPCAHYCAVCGIFLQDPAHSTGDAADHKQVSFSPSLGAPWQPHPSSSPSPSMTLAPPTVDKQTQTVGVFFPSAAELRRREQQRALEQDSQDQRGDRRALVTAISPGRGFWRKQVDHVCAYLRSFTQNNMEFRALMGEPCMGRMVSAVIQEDEQEVSLRMNFVSAGAARNQQDNHKKPHSRSRTQNLSAVQNLSSVTERHNPESANCPTLKTGWSAAFRTSHDRGAETLAWPQLKDSHLLEELGPGGRGQISVVQQLIDEGANPCCHGNDGHPALVVAVMNSRHDVLPVLVQRGADVNQQSGRMNNTALHVAASLGSKGLQSVEVLLSCKASISRMNVRGQTAFDLAVTSGCPALVSLLAARTGQDFLDQLVRPTASFNNLLDPNQPASLRQNQPAT